MFPTRILLAVDGSPGAARAARMAIELSNKLDSELHVVYVEPAQVHNVSERMIYTPDTRDYLGETFERFAREKLDEEAARIREAGGKVAGAYARLGRPDAEIVSLAEELEAGLVVLGSRGLGPLRRAVLGSVASSVVRHSHTSVLVVRGEGIEEKGRLPGRILLALDGSEHAVAAARTAIEIAGGTGSELYVLHVLPTPYPGPGAWETGEEELEEARRSVREFVDGQVERTNARVAMATEVHVAYGRPDAEIVQLGESLDADLVVIGSRGLGRLRRALLGSVSDSVVRHAHCPVLVVRGGIRSSGRRAERREGLMAEEDLVTLASDFDAAWNAHDEEAVLGFFTDDAVVRFEPSLPGEPEAYAGKEEIKIFVRRHMPGFRVESRDHQVAGHQEAVGDRVIWESTVSAESFRDFGVDPAEGTVEAIVKDGKIEAFSFSLSQETLEKMQEAGEPT